MFDNVIINDDSMRILPSIPSKSADLVMVDPPYGIGYKNWDNIDFLTFTEEWVSECFRILKSTGTMWSFMGYEHILDFVPILQKYGEVHLENWVVWARQKGRGSSKHLKSIREDIFHITKSDKFTWNNIKVLKDVVVPYMKDGKPRGWFINEKGERKRWTGLGNVWVYTAPFWKSKDRQIHPAQKPLMMIERLILLSSNENDVVLDPFSGSGVAAVACQRLNRKFLCIEKDKEHYEKSVERLNEEIKESKRRIF